MKKRFLSVFLALALCVGVCAVPSLAAGPEFVIENGVLTKYNGPGGNVTIPNGVTAIGNFAFVSCSNLVSVTIPTSVTAIGDGAFSGCRGLTNVSIPAGVTTIGESAFENCSRLTGITIPAGVTTINGYTFFGCSSLTSVIIPSSVTSIVYGAFRDCAALTSVTIPTSVTDIGADAFSGCTALTSVTIPASVTYIGAYAFGECSCLTDVYYGGTQAQWSAIKMDKGGDFRSDLTNVTIHYNSTMPEAPAFTDVPAGQWYADAVNWAVSKVITNGTGGGKFSPGKECTHEQILTFLYRAARGEGKADAADMDKAVEWAREKGMIDSGFDGKALCTRADAVTYIWQALGKEDAKASSFSDVPAGADCAKAVDWAVANGVTEGTGNGNFSPDKVCNRGTIVTFLHRAYVPAVRLK